MADMATAAVAVGGGDQTENRSKLIKIGNHRPLSNMQPVVFSLIFTLQIFKEHIMDSPISEERRPAKHFCSFGRCDGTLVICKKACDATGAFPEWMTAEKSGFIVTPWYCENRCLWWREQHVEA